MGNHEHAEMLEAIARESLRVHLRDAGLNAREDGDRLQVGLDGVSCRVFTDDPTEYPDMWVVPFWFELSLDQEGTTAVRESLAGIGSTLKEAAVTAAHDWMETIFSPIRAMLDPGYHDDGVKIWKMTSLDGETDVATQWKIYAGPPRIMPHGDDAVRQALARRAPFTYVLREVTGYLHLRERHWVKTLLSRSGGEFHGHVTIDNGHDEDAFEALKQFDWTPAEGFGMFRQFHIMEPDPEAEPPSDGMLEDLRARL